MRATQVASCVCPRCGLSHCELPGSRLPPAACPSRQRRDNRTRGAMGGEKSGTTSDLAWRGQTEQRRVRAAGGLWLLMKFLMVCFGGCEWMAQRSRYCLPLTKDRLLVSSNFYPEEIC